MLRKSILFTTLAIGFSVTQAQAATCTVNIEQAYQAAVQRGFGFKCYNAGVLSFDGAKRVGCFTKTGLIGASTRACFFSRGNDPAGFNGGWQLHSYKITGGQYSRVPHSTCTISFRFSTKAGSRARRHVSELKLKKDGGNCANVMNEAF